MPVVRNTDTTCSDKQTRGYDFSDLNVGSFSAYDKYKFSGYTCKDAPLKSRSNLSKRTSSRCVSAQIQPNTYSNAITCDSAFSISYLEVSVDISLLSSSTTACPMALSASMSPAVLRVEARLKTPSAVEPSLSSARSISHLTIKSLAV